MRILLRLGHSNTRLRHWMEKIRCRGWIPPSTLAKGVAGDARSIAKYGHYFWWVHHWLCSCEKLTRLTWSHFGNNRFLGLVVWSIHIRYSIQRYLSSLLFNISCHSSLSSTSMGGYFGSRSKHCLCSLWNWIYEFTASSLVSFTVLHCYISSIFGSRISHPCDPGIL